MFTTGPDINSIGLVVGAAILLFLVLWLLLRRRPVKDAGEGHGIADGAAAAIEDAVGQLLGVDAHPDRGAVPALPEAVGEPDALTTLKGLGPKAALLLNAQGILRFDQLAALNDAQQTLVDDGMGTFKGRLHRDRWVEQARYLADGDRAGFEAQFGKLG